MGGAPARQSAEATPAPRAAEPGRSQERRRVQTALKLSDPGDAAEREAVATARNVMQMRDPVLPARARVPMLAARAPSAAPAESKAKKDEVSPELTAEIRSQVGGGRPLSPDTRSFLEPRFKANFAGVRVHTGGKAENLATRLGARAFTFGKDIFFNAGAFAPDSPEGMELIAHELTHTIQQREVVQREIIQREEAVTVQQRSEPQVQRGIVSEALDWIADKANVIPGFRLFTIVIGRNPINMSKVDRSGANILRALIEFIPGGGLIVQALENHGIFEKGGKFIEDQFAALRDLGGAVWDGLMEFVDSLGVRDIFRLGSLWDRAKRIFTVPVDKAIAFGKGLVSGIAELVKDAIVKPLGRWAAANIPKWNLLVGVFGKNPISDEGESPASSLIGAFMELIGQKEIWENIKKGNAVAKAWAWFQGAMKGALSLVTSIPGRVMSTIRSLTIFDIVTLVGAFTKIVTAFSSFVGSFMSWAGGTVLQLLEIILSVVAPSVIPYLKKAGGAFSSIIKNPVGFVRTLVRAGIQGFRQFAGNFLAHLKAALIGWLTGSLGGLGIYIPSGFTIIEILKFVLSVMGLTWVNIRAKLVAATNETVVKALETGFDIVKTLVTEGPAAAWQKIVETLTNLKQMAIDAVMDFVKSKVVEAAVTKLLSMLSPAGAFIQAIIAIYNTIMFFVERIRQIAAVAASFIDGIAAIAAGNVAPAANRVEKTMAGLLVLVISFLARIAGLGKVSDAVVGLVKKIRAPIEKALDKVVAWIVASARKLGKFVAQAGVPQDPNERLRLASKHAVTLAKPLAGKATAPLLNAALSILKTRYALTALEPYEQAGEWWVTIRINPVTKQKLVAGAGAAGAAGGPTGLDRQGPLLSLADRAAAISAMNAIASKTAPGITAIGSLADAKFTQYKSEYVSTYAAAKAVGAHFQWPHFYLRTRAARRAGFDAESKWRPIVFPGSGAATFDVVRKNGTAVVVIPDVLTGSVVGDIKNWASLSFTQQLQDFALIANPANATSVKRAGRPYSALRKLSVAVRHESHLQGKTAISGPLQGAISATGGNVHYAITDHIETADEFAKSRNWPKT
jgi:predicted XRE-type DNA-binding protein